MRWVCQGMLPWWSDAWERREKKDEEELTRCKQNGRAFHAEGTAGTMCRCEYAGLNGGHRGLDDWGRQGVRHERGEAAETTLRHVQRTPALQTSALRMPVHRREASSRMQLNTLLLSSRKPCLVNSTVHRVAIWFTFWSKLLILDNCSSSQPAASQWLHISDHCEEVCLYPKNNGKSQKNFFFIYFY